MPLIIVIPYYKIKNKLLSELHLGQQFWKERRIMIFSVKADAKL